MNESERTKERERIAAGLRAMSRAPEALVCNDGTLGGAAICGVPVLYCEGATHPVATQTTTKELNYFPVWSVSSRDDLVDIARFAAAYDEWF